MKKLCCVFYLSLVSICSLFGQDQLIRIQGDTISVNVLKITENYIEYTETETENEQIFIIKIFKFSHLIKASGEVVDLTKRNDIAHKNDLEAFPKVSYHNEFLGLGFTSKFKKYKRKELTKLYHEAGAYDAIDQLNAGRIRSMIGGVLGFVSAAMTASALYTLANDNLSINPHMYYIVPISVLVSTILNSSGSRLMKRSVHNYNDQISLRLEGTENGIGLIMDF